MGKTIIFFIRGYQRFLSPESGLLARMAGAQRKTCAFYPSCSSYAIEAIEKKGALRGALSAAKRLLRCHPWQRPQVDLVQ